MLAELERLNDVSMDHVAQYQHLATEAAETEAAYKALKAKAVLMAKANGVKGIAEAEYHADATPEIAGAYQERLVAAAKADACREALRSIRTNQDALRTAVASHRSPIQGPGM